MRRFVRQPFSKRQETARRLTNYCAMYAPFRFLQGAADARKSRKAVRRRRGAYFSYVTRDGAAVDELLRDVCRPAQKFGGQVTHNTLTSSLNRFSRKCTLSLRK